MKTQIRLLRALAYSTVLLAVLALVSPTPASAALDHSEITLFAVFDGTTKVSEQTNGPVITESQAPGGGNPPWQWEVSDLSGFSVNPNFQFTVQNADGTQAQLSWDPISDSDWLTSGGLEGSFTLTLKNGVDPDIVYQVGSNPFGVSLRRTDVADFTVFQGQTGGGDSIPATDTGTYTFGVAPGSLSSIPSDVDLGLTNRGAISVNDPGTAAWTEDGTFTLRINHGTRPFCDLENLPLHLRKLVGTGFTVFQRQTGGGDAIPSGDTDTYTFAIAPGTLSGIPSDVGLSFTNRGAISVSDVGTATWSENGQFTMRVTPSAGPYCDVANLDLRLRQLVDTDFTVFQRQTGSGDCIPPADTGTYGFAVAPGSFSGIDSSLDLGFTNRGAISINDPGSVAWNEDGTFTMRITPAAGTYCDVASLNMSLRQIVPESLRLVDDGSTGSVELQVQGDPGPWDWSDYTDGLASSELTAPNTLNSVKLTISWGAGDLAPIESGYGTFTIQPSDGSAPFSTVEIFTAIVGPEVWVWVDDDYTDGGYNDGHTWGYDAFDSIQDGIDAEILATLVKVAAGIYYENITMVSGVSVIGAGPDISIIDGNSNGSVVTAIDVNSTAKLSGFTIMNGSATHGGGMYCYNSSPLVSNCLFTGNSGDYGGGIYSEYECNPSFKNCTFAGNSSVNGNAIACDSSGQSNPSILEIRDSIIWDGINGIWNNDGSTITINYSDIQGGWSGVGNLDSDPNFADPCNGDYHLMSQAGRWYNQTQYLVYDEVTSPCIDAGDPSSSIGFEITPNGALVNMGAFGGTWQASRSYFDSTPCPEPVIGDINGDCKINFVDFAFIADHWLEDNSH